MADTFKKLDSDLALSWEDTQVEKEHQPEKVKSNLTYRSMENQVAMIGLQITSLTAEKAALEADMILVKAAAEVE
tara:strand:- start:1372 stop:1596 length:225 start_codon:yes stop_codon:yes gene_type:complete